MSIRSQGLLALATALLASSTLAQTFPEIEPNSGKSEATAVTGIVAGDTIGGTSTGTVVTAGSTLATTIDTYRVRTGALPAGIYRHSLSLTTSTTVGNIGSIRGFSQAAGVINTASDIAFQTSSTATAPARTNVWYGFGNQEEIYYRVTGTTATTAAYTSTMNTSAVTPTAIAGSFNAGPITLASAALQTTDTEIYVYDSSFNPIPLGHNDDPFPGAGAGPSSITVNLSAGTYFVAVSNYNTANNASDANPTEFYLNENVLEFPGAIANNNTTAAGLACSITVTDGATTTPMTANKNLFNEIMWGTFTVVGVVGPPANDNCANAISITGGSAGGSLGSATNDGAASCDPGGVASKDVWYSFTAGAFGGTLNVDTCGSTGIDTALSIYASCGGSELACNDDCGGSPCGATLSCTSVALAANQVVLIRVSDKGLGGNNFFINRTFVANPPSNDDCSTPIAVGTGLTPVNTTSATTGTQGQAEALCTFFGFTVINKDVWFTYTPTQSGPVVITTCTTLGAAPLDDSKIAVYAGAGCPTVGTAIACSDDDAACAAPNGFNSTVTFASTCGTTYLIQIGYYGGNAAGSIAGSFSITQSGTTCSTPFTVNCDGSSVGTTCVACGNNGVAGKGCANSVFPGGTQLVSGGIASVSLDTLTLTTSDMTGPGLFFQSSGLAGSPIGFGDGSLCAAVGIQRLGVVFPTAGSATYPGGLTPAPISIGGGPISAGNTKHYQAWYRDTPVFCTASTFNTSNGISLVWGP